LVSGINAYAFSVVKTETAPFGGFTKRVLLMNTLCALFKDFKRKNYFIKKIDFQCVD